jgi:hypothetical protein
LSQTARKNCWAAWGLLAHQGFGDAVETADLERRELGVDHERDLHGRRRLSLAHPVKKRVSGGRVEWDERWHDDRAGRDEAVLDGVQVRLPAPKPLNKIDL